MESDLSAPRRVEAYLDQILAPLTHRLSAFYRDELRRELRAHLWARIDAYQELGHSKEEAVTEALKQFGGEEDFLRQWQHEWMKTTPLATLREMWTATCCALLLSIPALLITCFGSPIWSQYTHEWGPEWIRSGGFTYVTSSWGGFALNFILLPLALGTAVGHLKPRCAGIGVLGALTLEVGITHWFSMGSNAPNLGRFVNGLCWQVFTCSVYWLPLACTSAALTGWWTGRRLQIRRNSMA